MRYTLFAFFLVSCSQREASLETSLQILPSPATSASNVEVQSVPEPSRNVLGWWESAYVGVGGRAKNIELAASSIDGRQILPGQKFSFNESVGERTIERGYVSAPVISKGEMENGIGGGICQVSSTLFAAAVTADLEIVERFPHSHPIPYMPIGLDATVSFPKDCEGNFQSKSCYLLDLKIKNPLNEVLIIHTSIRPDSKRKLFKVLRIEVIGSSEPTDRPTYSYGSKKKDEFVRRTKRIDGVSSDYVKRTQKGMNGMVVMSVFTWSDQKTRSFQSNYPPTDEIWEVSSDRPSDAPDPWVK